MATNNLITANLKSWADDWNSEVNASERPLRKKITRRHQLIRRYSYDPALTAMWDYGNPLLKTFLGNVKLLLESRLDSKTILREQVVRALEPACHFGGKTRQLSLFHQSATGFSENVVQAEKRYKILEFFFKKKRSTGEGLTSRSNGNNFFSSEERSNEAFWSVYFFRIRKQYFKSDLVFVVFLVSYHITSIY